MHTPRDMYFCADARAFDAAHTCKGLPLVTLAPQFMDLLTSNGLQACSMTWRRTGEEGISRRTPTLRNAGTAARAICSKGC